MGKPKVDILVLQTFAKSKGGILLSTVYINAHEKLLFECSKGHQWEANYNNIHSGKWCPTCSGNKKGTLEECHNIAKSRNGLCLSNTYVNNRTLMSWKCNIDGHIWNTSFGTIKNSRSWCSVCSNNMPSVNKIQEFINSTNFGGTIISTKYINSNSPLLFQCKEGHQWYTRWRCVYFDNTWCPKCAPLKSEKECISLAENILNMPLTKKRIFYDSINKRKFLEFDGYNEEYKIAVEYNGIQHYKYVPYFHNKKTKTLEIQQERDNTKRIYCKEHNITLIEISYDSDVKDILLQHQELGI